MSFDPGEYGASGIAELYDRLYADEWDTDGAVDAIVELAAGGPVLEFGIGTGRLALPLVARGVEVHGIDGSREMVDQLRAKPAGTEVPVTIGDFSTTVVERGDFSVVVLAANTIFALPDQAAQVACFANAARHLRPGGRFVVEAWIADLASFHDNRRVRPRVLTDGLMSIESALLELGDQRMRTTQAVFWNGGVSLFPANHRYAWPAELDLMAQMAGMPREQRWADWRGEPFGDRSQQHVTVYSRLTGDDTG
jgi:SAM-dependent methyltransferase